MDPKVKERIDELLDLVESGEITDAQIDELRGLIVNAFNDVDEGDDSREATRTMSDLAHAADKLQAFLGRRTVAQLSEAEPVTASARAQSNIARLARRSSRPVPSPEATPTRERVALVASGNLLGGAVAGQPISDRMELAHAMADTLSRMSKSGPARGRVVLASAHYRYQEDRQIGDSAEEAERKIGAVCDSAALAATGGICQPVNVDYAVPTWATADRPLRDGLPAFQATRGGIRFVKPPDISALEAATSIWTEATDASPGEATKPVLRIECGSEEHVFVEAVPTRLGFGNMMGRFAPEQVAANTDLASAAAARIAENNLLNLIAEKCVKNITTGTVLGATRDLITAINQTVAGYRNLHRIPDASAITVVLPVWARELVKADLARELAHGQTAEFNTLAVTPEMVTTLLRAHGVNPIFHLDGQPSAVSGGVAQTFAAPEEGKAIKPFPTKLVWYAFVEGSVQFLDGGRLDLGVVRDSTLDATNDYEVFLEPFESIAFRGFSAGAWQLVSTLCGSGASAGTLSTEGKCA
jgi:hypothetical protein